jgi:hypothetical protein
LDHAQTDNQENTMAKGDFVLFAQAKLDLGKAIHNLSADALKFGVIKSAANGGIDPVEATPDPRWGAGGSTNLLLSEVTPGGSYVTGGPALTGVSWALTGAVAKLDSNDINIPMDAAAPTNGRWGILYSSTAAGKQALGFVDFGGDINITQDALDYFVDAANGWFKYQ